MIRSTRTSLKFANSGRKTELGIFLSEYRRVVSSFVDMLWSEDKVPCLLPKQFTSQVSSWLTARMIQCAGKQASAIVRGTRQKHDRRVWMLNSLKSQGKNTASLQAALAKEVLTKPSLANLPAELDERFVKVDLANKTSFDGWITLGCLGRKKILLPFKRHAHFAKVLARGIMTKGIRLREKDVTFMFEIPSAKKTEGSVLGIDVGISSCLATSDGLLTKADVHGHTLTSILKKVARCKKGSNGFRKAAQHRKNFVNWSINQLDLDNVKEVRCEDVKNLRQGKKTSRFLSNWTYADTFEKLERLCEDRGVLVTKVNPAYTSQTCPRCRTLGKRRGKKFSCSCGYKNDADLNAAVNLAGEPIVPRENVFP